MKIKFRFVTSVSWDQMVTAYLYLRQMNSLEFNSKEGGLTCKFERPMPEIVRRFYPLLKTVELNEVAEYNATTKTMKVVNTTETTKSEYVYEVSGDGNGTVISGHVKIPTILVAGFKPFVKSIVQKSFEEDKMMEVDHARS